MGRPVVLYVYGQDNEDLHFSHDYCIFRKIWGPMDSEKSFIDASTLCRCVVFL